MHEHAAIMHGLGMGPHSSTRAAAASNFSQLVISQWNVHGLRPEKLITPQVARMVDQADVLVFTETWMESDNDIPDRLKEGFSCYAAHGNRSNRGGRGVGGVLVCAKQGLNPRLHKYNTNAGIVWIRIPRHGGGRDIFIAACYFQPEGSTIWRRTGVDPFEALESDIIEIMRLGEVVITGDLNARTGLEEEQNVAEAAACLAQTGDENLEAISDMLGCDSLRCLPTRGSQDVATNKWGKKLLSLCSAAALCILNGRLLGDMHGGFTFSSKAQENANSVVDYVITTPDLVFNADGTCGKSSLVVDQHAEFRLWSDHWPLTCKIEMQGIVSGPHGHVPANEPNRKRHRRRGRRSNREGYKWSWDGERQEVYTEALRNETVLLEKIMECDKGDGEGMIALLKAAVSKAATISGMPSKKQLPQPKPRHGHVCAATVAPWFSTECEAAYARVCDSEISMRATWEGRADATGQPPREGNKDQQIAARSFKLAVRRAKRRHVRARQAHLADLLANKPQAFWRVAKQGTKPADGLSKSGWHEYFQTLRSPHASPQGSVGQLYKPGAAAAHATELDIPFTEADIAGAIEKVKTGKSADKYGDVIELFVNPKVEGRPLLLPHLTRIVNAMFESGSYPVTESVGMIVTLYKGTGSKAEGKNYRGITIITALSKLYATAINMRLVGWRGQEQGRQARGQAGFTTDHRTADHAFVLQHAIHKYCRKAEKTETKSQGLFTCFVDLSKAFDTIDRAKLWDRLAELGIQGTMLQAIKAYYQNVDECVRTSEGFTENIRSEMGVRQGCPLSPTLFGFFIDKVESFISRLHPHSTVHVGSRRVPLLLYADDIVIMATSEWELQYMVALFSGFCSLHGLTVNIGKTAVVVFSHGRKSVQPPARIVLNGVYLEQREQYKYLGIMFHWRLGALKGGELMLLAARNALFAVQRQARSEQITDPDILFHMFDALVLPVMLYGCEIWGTYRVLRDNADRLQAAFMRRVLSLPMRTDTWAMLVELGRTPISHRIIEKIAAFRLRLHGMALRPRLLADAAEENFRWQAEGKSRDMKCWSVVSRNLIMHESADDQSLDMVSLKGWLASQGDAVLRGAMIEGNMDRREFYGTEAYAHAKGDRRRTYARWFWPGIRAIQSVTNRIIRMRLIRFRLGAHDLNVVSGAWAEGIRLPREKRMCCCCAVNKVEDETHLVFECPHYSIIRMGFEADIFSSEGDGMLVDGLCPLLSEEDVMMRKFFSQENQVEVAKFIQCCLRERKSALKVKNAGAVAQD